MGALRKVIASVRNEWNERDEHLRSAYRAWVRAHHPDLGGDVEEFIAGLAHWRARIAPPMSPPGHQVQVGVFRSRGGLWQVARWWRRRRRSNRRVL
ncbi:hypothetical protein GCM10022214_39810 [Actinomadura miaoliensis]|uniref:J domain-containing protein n=1 Tax=Actinomadura miaoliensis TaxID=430685 RepID=A0ABP7VZU7_9ACTN